MIVLEREVKVIKFRGDPARMNGIVEVRGIVNKDGTISYGEYTQYDNEFGKSIGTRPIDLSTHEKMLEYYHGMCRDLCVK